jgi:hypothetical protein
MLTGGLLHTAAPLAWTAAHCHAHSRTAALCRTSPCALPHTAGHSRARCHTQPHTADCRTAAHCRLHCHTLRTKRTASHCRSHLRALPHCRAYCRTTAQPHTAARTAVHYQAHCRTLPHALRAHYCAHCHKLSPALLHTAALLDSRASLSIAACWTAVYEFIHMNSYKLT